MKAFVLLACVCAAAHAQQFGGRSGQYQSNFAQSSASFGTTARPQQNALGRGQSNFGNQHSDFENQPSAFGNHQSGFGNQQSAFGNQQASLATQSGFANQQPARQSYGSCKDSERSPVAGSCDRYNECVNGTVEEKLCPDGLRFNPEASGYPCVYPNEFACLERSASLQPAQPTKNCPHQFGFFRLGDAKDCSRFRSCVSGVNYDFECPEGLAFNPESYQCDWADQVAECDAEAFLGFRCPEVPTSPELGAPAGYRYFSSDNNCQKYFICIENRPRMLTCGGDLGFDELTSSCVFADEVSACPAELRASAQQSRDNEKQRLAKQLEFDARKPHLKRRF